MDDCVLRATDDGRLARRILGRNCHRRQAFRFFFLAPLGSNSRWGFLNSAMTDLAQLSSECQWIILDVGLRAGDLYHEVLGEQRDHVWHDAFVCFSRRGRHFSLEAHQTLVRRGVPRPHSFWALKCEQPQNRRTTTAPLPSHRAPGRHKPPAQHPDQLPPPPPHSQHLTLANRGAAE